MRRLDKVLITIGILSLAILCVCELYIFINPRNQWGSFSPEEKQYSYDGKYYSIQTIEHNGFKGKVIVRLYSSIDDELICELEPCRSWDYWGMVWENDRYAFWIQSGDIGVFCIELVNGEWIENWKRKEPDYIESRYDDFEQLEYFSNACSLEQYSFDLTYYLTQEYEDGKVNIRIYTSIDDELVFELEPFSSTGYHGTVWEYDRNAFWIKSDDIGTFCIELVDGEWVENRDRQLPEYIRSIGETISE